MERTWKLTAAGIMTIISGCYGIGFGADLLQGAPLLDRLFSIIWIGVMPSENTTSDLVFYGILYIVLGVIALIGGIFALRRKVWGLALTGAILSIPLFLVGTILGILSIVFLSRSKGEFV